MSVFHIIYGIWVLLSPSCYIVVEGSASCCPHQFFHQSNRRFEQKADRFWKFSEQADRWIEVQLPYDLVSCVNKGCSKVNNQEGSLKQEHEFDDKRVSLEDGNIGAEKSLDVVLPLRKRISLTKMSETSIWVTGESGSMYERFWNGLEWVIAPHDLPISAGRAVAVFIINHIILAISEAGNLYQVRTNVYQFSKFYFIENIHSSFQIHAIELHASSLACIKFRVTNSNMI